MAEPIWGPIQTGQYSARIGVELVQSPSTVTSSTSSVTVTARIWLWTQYRVTGDTVNLSWSGSFGSGSASQTVSVGSQTAWSTTNRLVLRTLTRTVTPSYSASVTSSLSASLGSLSAVNNKTLTASASIVTGRKPVSAPAAPTNVSVTQASNTSHTLRWTANSTASAPWDNVIVQRWDNVGGAYKTVATLAGSATSYVDRSTSSAARYRWRVAGRNKAGTSSYAVTDYVYTSPAPVTGLKAVRSGTDVIVSWTQSAGLASAYGAEVVRRTSTSAWDYAGVKSVAPGVTTWTDPNPDPTQLWQYAVRSTVAGPSGALVSVYVQSDLVQLLTPPAAPVPETVAVVESGTGAPFRWKHSSRDGTGQTRWELRWRVAGTTLWTTVGATGARQDTTSTAAGANGGTVIEWQVRTWGEHADPSPWSPLTSMRVADAPFATLTSPADGTVNSSTVRLAWTFFDPEGEAQRAWQGEILDASGTTVWAWGSGSSTSVRPSTLLQDGQTYTARVRVQSFTGLWSEWAEQVFAVNFLPPPTPVVEVEWDHETGTLALTYATPDPESDQVAAVSCQVWRSIEGGPWRLIADDLPVTSTITDPTTPLGIPTSYRVVSVSALPSTADSLTTTVVPEPRGWVFLSAGPGWSQMVKVRDNVRISPSWDRESALVHLAGRDLPISVRGEGRTHTIGVSARLAPNPDGGATWAELRRFVELAEEPILYRDPKGHRLFVALNAISGEHERVREEGSFTVTEIDYDEGGLE